AYCCRMSTTKYRSRTTEDEKFRQASALMPTFRLCLAHEQRHTGLTGRIADCNCHRNHAPVRDVSGHLNIHLQHPSHLSGSPSGILYLRCLAVDFSADRKLGLWKRQGGLVDHRVYSERIGLALAGRENADDRSWSGAVMGGVGGPILINNCAL